MPKKILIILAILTVLGVGGFFAWQVYQTQQAQKAAAEYAASSDKIADDLMRDLTTQNIDHAYTTLFSTSLRQDYSKDYWSKTFFPRFKDKDQPTRHAKEAVDTSASTAMSPYLASANQQPTRYEYDFTISDLTYRVTCVVFKVDSQWKVNELTGAFLP